MEFLISEKSSVAYTIAGISIRLETPWKEKIQDEFTDFLGNAGENHYRAEFREVEELPSLEGQKIYENQGFFVLENATYGYIRLFHDERKKEIPYAVSFFDWEKRIVRVEALKDHRYYFQDSRNDFFHIGWERLLINEWRMILHASFIETAYGGILFSGPSGIGKSTQADLWHKYAGSRVVNGDSSILCKKEKLWYAYGSPYAGSSRYHVNECCKARAIVVIKQGQQCALRRLQAMEAFKKIFSQLTVNSWDCEYVSRVSKMAVELVHDIPVYELVCTPDKKAIEILKIELERGDAE